MATAFALGLVHCRIGGVEQGLRYLHCSLCDTEWHLTRVQCSNCSNTTDLGYFALEGAGEAVKAEPLNWTAHPNNPMAVTTA